MIEYRKEYTQTELVDDGKPVRNESKHKQTCLKNKLKRKKKRK